MRRLYALIALALTASPAFSHPAITPEATLPQEARAMWVVRYSLVSPEKVHAVVETAARYHFNALMVQVRGRGDAYYRSNLEPRADALQGQPADFDPLAQLVREAHARNIQVFAWMDMMLVWSGPHAPQSSGHVVAQHPDWVDTFYDGSTMSGTDEEGQFLNPGIPAVRQYTVSVCRDLVRNYDVDGIHLDYIRYPSATLGYNLEALREFYSTLHADQTDVPRWRLRAATRAEGRAWIAWRQQQVTNLVGAIRTAIHQEKPWVSLSAAVWANLDDAEFNRMQDWPTWLNQGLVDFVCPMAYSTNTERVCSQIARAVQLSHGRQIWAGLGAWLLSPAATAEKIRAVRALGVSGICLFSYDGITDGGSSTAFLDQLSKGPLATMSCCPTMPWLAQRPSTTALRASSTPGSYPTLRASAAP